MLTRDDIEYLQYSHIALEIYKRKVCLSDSGFGRVCNNKSTKLSCMKSYDLYYFLLLYKDWIKNDPNYLNNPLDKFEFDSQGFLDGRVNGFMETAGLRPYGFHLGNITEGSATYLFDSNKGIHFCIRDQENQDPENQDQVFCGGVYTCSSDYNNFFAEDESGRINLNNKINIIFEAIVKIANEIIYDVRTSRNMAQNKQEIILDNVFFFALSYLNPNLFRSWIRSSLCYLLERFKDDNITSTPNSHGYIKLNENETFKEKSERLKTISSFYYNSNNYFESLWEKIQISDKNHKNDVRKYYPSMKTLFYDDSTNWINGTKVLVNLFYNVRVRRGPKKEDQEKFEKLYNIEKQTELYIQLSEQVKKS